MDSGKQALAQGQGREAAIAYAHAAQLEPSNPMIHLGLAEANLASAHMVSFFKRAREYRNYSPQAALKVPWPRPCSICSTIAMIALYKE